MRSERLEQIIDNVLLAAREVGNWNRAKVSFTIIEDGSPVVLYHVDRETHRSAQGAIKMARAYVKMKGLKGNIKIRVNDTKTGKVLREEAF